MKILIYNPKTNLFDFFIKSIIEEFNSMNLSERSEDKDSSSNISIIENINYSIENINYSKDILLIIINPHFIFDYLEIKNDIILLSKKFKYKIFYITEPINFIVEKKVYQDIIRIINPFALWTYTYENFNKLNIKQPIFKIFPNNNAYHFLNITEEQLKNRNSDKIVFIGNITDNRKDICDSFDHNLINYNNSWSKEQWIDILSSNLFYLNIHRRVGCKSFESFRIVPILANGGFIISERCNEKEELLYKDYNILFVERDQLLNSFIKYKNNISYQDIYNRCILFRNSIDINNSNLHDFINYYNNIL